MKPYGIFFINRIVVVGRANQSTEEISIWHRLFVYVKLKENQKNYMGGRRIRIVYKHLSKTGNTIQERKYRMGGKGLTLLKLDK